MSAFPTYRLRATLGALLFSLVPTTARAAPPPPRSPAVFGVVSDSANAPLANATVIVAEVGRSTTTNAVGEFVLRGLPAGEYHLSITLLGYAPGHLVVRVAADGPDVRVRITLRATLLRLSSVVVTASPTGTQSERLTQTAIELSGAALARTVSSSVAATLSTEPGVSQRYGGPAATMPVIRGLTGDRILVLQDGERSGDLAAASGDHSVSVDPLAAQRIEVVRGPASLLYGNNALGGVVNVISNDIPTSVPTHVEGSIGSQAETVTPGAALNVGLSTPLGARNALSVRAGYRDMGSLRTGGGATLDGTQSLAINGALGYGFIGERGNLGLVARYYEFDYGIPAEAGDPQAGIRVEGRRIGLSARGGQQLASAAVPYLRVEGTAQDYAHDEVEPDGSVGTQFELRTQTLNAQVSTAFGPWKGAIGAQGLFKQYAASGEDALTPAADSRGVGLFLYQEIVLRETGAAHPGHEGDVNLQLGARWDDYVIASKRGAVKFGPGRSRAFRNGSGSIGLSWAATDRVSLSGSLARAFRAPTVEELHSNGMHAALGTYDMGNPSLVSETSSGAELILRVRGDRMSAQLSTYLNRVDAYVTPDIVGDTLIDGDLVPVNRFRQADAQLSGVEGSLETRIGARFVATLMGDLVRGEFAGGDALPFMPPARVGAGLRWERARFRASADVRHSLAQDRVSGGAVDIATDAFTVVNLSAGMSWLVGNVLHQVTLRGDNIGDTRSFDSASRIKRFAANPGRNLSLVYQVQF